MNLHGNPQNLAAYQHRYKLKAIATNLQEIEASGEVRLTHLVGSNKQSKKAFYFPNGTVIPNE